MTSSNAMRQLEERHVATKVELMVWSTKMDLLALSHANGKLQPSNFSYIFKKKLMKNFS